MTSGGARRQQKQHPASPIDTVSRNRGAADHSEQRSATATLATNASLATGTESAPSVRGVDWWPTVLGSVVVLVSFAILALLWRGAAPDVTEPVAVSIGQPIVVDDFVRRDRAELATAPTGQAWSAVRGSWAVIANRAVLVDPYSGGDQVSLAVIDFGASDGIVRATIVSDDRSCGVVGRFVDRSNYYALTRVPQFGVWNVERVTAGAATRLAVLQDVGDSPTDVQLQFIGDQITATAGTATVSVTDSALSGGTRVGLYAKVPQGSTCAWTSFAAIQPPGFESDSTNQ